MQLSIITINYNNAEGLEKTIKSIAGQTFRDFEYLVIDGGSSDGSRAVIQKYEERISYQCSEKDSGVYNAMNKGILKATGDYLLFLNSGDCLHDSRVLEEIVPLLGNEDIVYGDLQFVTPQGERKEVFVYPDVLSVDYFLERSLGHPASFIRRNLFGSSLYDESFRIVSDWKFFLEKIVLEGVPCRHVTRVVSDFDTGGISSSALVLCDKEREQVLRTCFPGMVCNALQSAARMRKEPLYDLFCELGSTRRFQYRVRPLIAVLLKVNRIFSRSKS